MAISREEGELLAQILSQPLQILPSIINLRQRQQRIEQEEQEVARRKAATLIGTGAPAGVQKGVELLGLPPEAANPILEQLAQQQRLLTAQTGQAEASAAQIETGVKTRIRDFLAQHGIEKGKAGSSAVVERIVENMDIDAAFRLVAELGNDPTKVAIDRLAQGLTEAGILNDPSELVNPPAGDPEKKAFSQLMLGHLLQLARTPKAEAVANELSRQNARQIREALDTVERLRAGEADPLDQVQLIAGNISLLGFMSKEAALIRASSQVLPQILPIDEKLNDPKADLSSKERERLLLKRNSLVTQAQAAAGLDLPPITDLGELTRRRETLKTLESSLSFLTGKGRTAMIGGPFSGDVPFPLAEGEEGAPGAAKPTALTPEQQKAKNLFGALANGIITPGSPEEKQAVQEIVRITGESEAAVRGRLDTARLMINLARSGQATEEALRTLGKLVSGAPLVQGFKGLLGFAPPKGTEEIFRVDLPSQEQP